MTLRGERREKRFQQCAVCLVRYVRSPEEISHREIDDEAEQSGRIKWEGSGMTGGRTEPSCIQFELKLWLKQELKE